MDVVLVVINRKNAACSRCESKASKPRSEQSSEDAEATQLWSVLMKSDTFREEYNVKINRKGQGGFLVIGEIVEVEVTLYPGIREKCNHDKAADLARKMHPGCEIVSVTYV